MNNVNFNLEMEKIISNLPKDRKPKLCLHACCAPCSSSVLERLSDFFDVTIFFYNPNIHPEEEYYKRLHELERLANTSHVKLISANYDPMEFFDAVKGYENCKEGETRCKICYQLRMKKCVEFAKANHFDFFCTTLSVSPHKNSLWINEIGECLNKEFDVPFLYSDFKKKNGYLRSIKLSQEYGFYRQQYCGCVFSQSETE